jgi:hypothetical protein
MWGKNIRCAKCAEQGVGFADSRRMLSSPRVEDANEIEVMPKGGENGFIEIGGTVGWSVEVMEENHA